jgi:hypothetical protein
MNALVHAAAAAAPSSVAALQTTRLVAMAGEVSDPVDDMKEASTTGEFLTPEQATHWDVARAAETKTEALLHFHVYQPASPEEIRDAFMDRVERQCVEFSKLCASKPGQAGIFCKPR